MPTSAPPNSIHPKTRGEWRAWLDKNHARVEGVWLITYKKATNQPRLDYEEAVEEALCFGWIDSEPGKLDAERAMLWFAPRKAGTGWSKTNKERVVKLLASGLIMTAGLDKAEENRRANQWRS